EEHQEYVTDYVEPVAGVKKKALKHRKEASHGSGLIQGWRPCLAHALGVFGADRRRRRRGLASWSSVFHKSLKYSGRRIARHRSNSVGQLDWKQRPLELVTGDPRDGRQYSLQTNQVIGSGKARRRVVVSRGYVDHHIAGWIQF